jgi:glutathione S-transferase
MGGAELHPREASERRSSPPGGSPEARLYVIPGSHACRAAMLMLEHKGIRYRTTELPTGAHGAIVHLLGFPGYRDAVRRFDGRTTRMLSLLDRAGTVPALRLGADRVQGSRQIARFLDEIVPEPPLFPRDAALRQQVEEAERWGDEELQMLARRIALATAARSLAAMRGRGAGGRLGPLLARNTLARAVAARTAASVFAAGAGNEQALLEQVPPALARIDAWIAAGVLGGEQLNAGDYLIAPSLALLDYRDDLRAQIADRPAGALLDRALPDAPPR